MNNKNNLLLPSIILGVCFLAAAFILAATWKSNYKMNQTITVTGSAKQDIVSDLGVLKGTITGRGRTAEAAYKNLQGQIPVVEKYLAGQGFPKDKIDFQTVNSYPVYEIGSNGMQTGNIKSYVYSQQIEIQSEDVNKIKSISLDIPSLVEKGIDFRVEMPQYHYTKLAELKIQIQADAAKDAMVRAEKIAESTGRKLGPMTNARMGVLQITPKLSNQVSNYGINDLSSIDKTITAVVNASFVIE